MNSLKISIVFIFASILISCSNSKINNVTFDSPPESIFKGTSVQLKAVVKGEGNPDTTLNWVIVEPVAKGTTIDKDGKLIIDQAEKLPSITVKAISAQDTSKSSIASIKVTVDLKNFLGNWIVKTNNDARELTLSEDLWVAKNKFTSNSYNIKDLKWTPIRNDDIATKDEFTDGYIITGIVDKVNKIANITQGQMVRYKLLINNDNSKILRVDMEPDLAKRGIDVIFTRDNQ